MLAIFEQKLTAAQQATLDTLTSPALIQAFVDGLTYNHADLNRCPLRVLDEREAHCLDGGLLAAAALRRLGYPALIVDLLPAPGLDDDHVLAVFQQQGHWGALAKSNFTGLRYREPVYRTLRELAMSYFEVYYNLSGLKTLRRYSRPIDLARWDRVGWMWDDAGVDALERHLKTIQGIALLSPEMVGGLQPIDRRLYEAGFVGARENEFFIPPDEA